MALLTSSGEGLSEAKPQENGPDVCDSESDSEHGDHWEEIPFTGAYTQEMLGKDGKPKNAGPQRLSNAQVLALRAAAQRESRQAESTTQSVSRPLVQADHTTQAPTSSRPPAPLAPDVHASFPLKIPKKKAPAKKSTQGGAGGQDKIGVQGAIAQGKESESGHQPVRTLREIKD
jgi:hypothetical protein